MRACRFLVPNLDVAPDSREQPRVWQLRSLMFLQEGSLPGIRGLGSKTGHQIESGTPFPKENQAWGGGVEGGGGGGERDGLLAVGSSVGPRQVHFRVDKCGSQVLQS